MSLSNLRRRVARVAAVIERRGPGAPRVREIVIRDLEGNVLETISLDPPAHEGDDRA